MEDESHCPPLDRLTTFRYAYFAARDSVLAKKLTKTLLSATYPQQPTISHFWVDR